VLSLGNDVGVPKPFAALLTAVLSFSLMQTMVIPALPDIQHELGTSTTAASWVLSAFLVVASVATGLIGRLGDMFGKRRLLLLTLGAFAVGTVVCAVADSIGLLIAGRAIQGLGAAAFPLAFGLVRDEFPRERVPAAIGLISATFGVGFGVGLVIAGLIVTALAWQWIFWIGLAMVLVAIVAVAAFVRESPVRSPGRVDLPGALLMCSGLVALLLAISRGNTWGWGSPRIVGLLVAAAALLLVFGFFETRIDQPLIDVRLLARPAVLTANLAGLVIGFGMFGVFTVLPQFVQTPPEAGYGFGSTVTEAGLFMLPMALAMLVAGPVTGYVGPRVGFPVTLAVSCVFGAAGYLVFATAHQEPWTIYLAAGVLGIGIGVGFSSLVNLIIEAVEPRQTGEATGINTIVRTVGGALGAQAAATTVAGSPVSASGFLAESGYTTAFVLSAGAMALATVAALVGRGAVRRAA
jgi:EmrB/QacA subfamily drug resistance transporter